MIRSAHAELACAGQLECDCYIDLGKVWQTRIALVSRRVPYHTVFRRWNTSRLPSAGMLKTWSSSCLSDRTHDRKYDLPRIRLLEQLSWKAATCDSSLALYMAPSRRTPATRGLASLTQRRLVQLLASLSSGAVAEGQEESATAETTHILSQTDAPV